MSWRLRAHRAATKVASAVPRAVSYALARVLGRLYALIPSARRVALTANIAAAHGLPETHPWVRRDVRRAFQHAMLNYVDFFGLERHDAPELIDSIYVEDWGPFDRAAAKGRGVILFSAHLGNFDTVVQKLAVRGERVYIPVEKIDPPDLLQAVRARRASMGMRIAPVGPDTFKQMAAHVRSGGTVVIVCDRDIQGTGLAVDFFGKQARLPQAAVLLALRTGAPLVGAFGYRFKDNSISGRLTEEIDLSYGDHGGRSTSFRAALEYGMKEIVAVLEREIRRDPGQWVMQQPVFAQTESTPAARTASKVEPAAPQPTVAASARGVGALAPKGGSQA